VLAGWKKNFTYDLGWHLLQKTDQAAEIMSFCYDNANRMTSSTDTACKSPFEYNARSQQNRGRGMPITQL